MRSDVNMVSFLSCLACQISRVLNSCPKRLWSDYDHASMSDFTTTKSNIMFVNFLDDQIMMMILSSEILLNDDFFFWKLVMWCSMWNPTLVVYEERRRRVCAGRVLVDGVGEARGRVQEGGWLFCCVCGRGGGPDRGRRREGSRRARVWWGRRGLSGGEVGKG